MPIFTSPHGVVDIPEVPLVDYVFRDITRHGSKTALVDGPTGEVVTYDALWQRVHRTCAGLQKRGLGKGDTLAVWSPNNVGFVVAFQSTVAAGAIVTTLNPAYSSMEVAKQLEDSGAKFLVTIPDFLGKVEEARKEFKGIQEVFVISNAPVAGFSAVPFRSVEVDAEPAHVAIDVKSDVCVLPYSSGTTGLPKGTMLTHFNIVANCQQVGHKNTINIQPDDCLLAVLPFYHIYGMVITMCHALHVGSKIVLVPGFEPNQYMSLLKGQEVSKAFVAPPIVQFLAKSPEVDKFMPLPKLQDLFCGAAPLGAALTEAAQQRLGKDVTIRQGYGMTEMSPVSHCDPFDRPPTLASIGFLMPNMECKIVDADGKEQTAGGEANAGEMWLRGPNVMKGYHRNPKATAESIDAEGYLHTGDIAYVDADGKYFIIDRLKELIKTKGFQVAPAELEATLVKHPQVADAAVIGVPADKYGGREGDGELPKAFVVLQPNAKLTQQELADWLAKQVAPYKQLKAQTIDFVPSVPKSASGKILRKDLRVMEKDRAARSKL